MSTPQQRQRGGMDSGIAVIALAGVFFLIYAGLELASVFAGHPGIRLTGTQSGQTVMRLSKHLSNPRAAFPPAVAARLPGPVLFYGAQALVLLPPALLVWLVAGWRMKGGHQRRVSQVATQIERLGHATRREIRSAYPVEHHSLVVGKTGRSLVGLPANRSLCVVAGSQLGKTSAAMGWILDAPGPVLATTTKVDLLASTAVLRERSTGQPTLVLDLEDLTGWPNKVRWSPLRGCERPSVASERAAALAAGMDTSNVTNSDFWKLTARTLLRLTLHAAAVSNADLRTFRSWVSDPTGHNEEVSGVLAWSDAMGFAPGWVGEWKAFLATNQRDQHSPLGSVTLTAGAVFEPYADPVVADLCSPSDDEAFDPAAWLASKGTLIVIASGHGASSTAPVAAALVDSIMREVRQVAARMPGGRLDPPLRCVLDELPSVAPLPGLEHYLADAAGQGVQLVAICQSMSQFAHSYGERGQRAIQASFGAYLVGGGIHEAAERDQFASLAGVVELPTQDWSNTALPGQRRPVVDQAELARLAAHTALLMSPLARPVRVDLERSWLRPGIAEAKEEARHRVEQATKEGSVAL